MALFKYTLPSGATFEMTAPAGTTQAQADKIFYEQVAAGTFVGYNAGDTLTHPEEVLANFGLSRLERGTAGVSTTTLAAITNGLPTVVQLPSLASTPLQNTITQVNYIQVNSNPQTGLFSQGPVAIGELSPTEVQGVMAQVINTTGQAYNQLTQESGVGKYGFNAQQLERAGYIKPGFAQMYCDINITTQANPANFVDFMTSPTPWTGLDGVNSVQVILDSEALQNKIQETLMAQSYADFVALGMIKPSTANTAPMLTTGHVYTSSGTLVSTKIDTLINTNIEAQ